MLQHSGIWHKFWHKFCGACTFDLTACAVLQHMANVLPSILWGTYSVEWPGLCYFEAIKMTSQAWSKFTGGWLVFSMLMRCSW